MNDIFQLDHKDERIAGILHAMGVSTGRAVNVVAREKHTIQDSLFSGGTRTLTSTYRAPNPSTVDGVIHLKRETVVVEHGTTQGRPSSVFLFVHPELFAALKPEQGPALGEAQKRVLAITATLTSAGRKDWRDRWDVPKADWDDVVVSLHALGLVRKNGAITPEGRNASDEGYGRSYHTLNGLTGE